MKSICLSAILLLSLNVHGQVSINTTGMPPASSAMLEVTSISKGVLIPRMTTTDRNGIVSPAASLMIYNTTTGAYNYWNGSSWMAIAAGNIKELSDANNNTKIQVEASADEDTIRFLANGIQQLRLDGKMAQLESAGNSLFLGHNAGKNDDGSDNYNLFIGLEAGKVTASGSSNTFVCQGTGSVNTASDNTFIGRDAGGSNTFGTANTFVGQGAGDLNTASNNTFIGKDAGGANTSGASNTFVGQGAGDANTASNNTFIGKDEGGAK